MKHNEKIAHLKLAVIQLIGKNGSSFFYSFLNQITNLVFGFTGFLILIRTLTKDSFGSWVLFLSITVLIEMGRNGFIQNGFIKFFLAEDDKNKKMIIGSSVILNFSITIISIIIINILAPVLASIWNSNILITLIQYYSITALASILYSQINFLMQARSDFKSVFIINLIRNSIMFLGIVIFAANGNIANMADLVLFQALGVLCGTFVGFIIIKNEIKFVFEFNKYWIKKLFNYGKYVCGTAISSIALNNVDNIMLAYLIGPASVAIYNIAFRIINFVEIPIATVSLVVFPRSAEAVKKNGVASVKYIYEKSVGVILAMVIPASILIFIFSKEIVLFIANEQYLDTVPILRIIVAYTLLKPFLRQFGITLDAIGKPQINFVTIILLTIINVFSNYIFIKFAGILGAAYGTLFTLSVGALICKAILERELDVKIKNIFIHLAGIYKEIIEIIKKSFRLKTV